MMFRMDESSPPGVSMVMRTAASRSAFAFEMPRSTYEDMNGSTTPFSLSDRTVGRSVAPRAEGPANATTPIHATETRRTAAALPLPILEMIPLRPHCAGGTARR